MTLQRLDILRLRAADGLASAEEEAELLAAGDDPGMARAERARWCDALLAPEHPDLASGRFADDVLAASGLDAAGGAFLRAVLDSVLRDPAGPSPELADAVLQQLGQVEPGRARLVAGLADFADAPDLSGAVVTALGQAPAADLGAALREAAGPAPELGDALIATLQLDDGQSGLSAAFRALGESNRRAPEADVADAVMAALGVAADADLQGLGAALSQAAGPAPSLWEDVARSIGADAAVVQADDAAPVVDLAAERQRRSPWLFRLAALAAAAAAVVLVFAGQTPSGDDLGPISYELAAVNEIEIEDISVGEDAIVQVLQFEADAPTIIFIDVPAEPLPAGGDEGATL